MSDELDVLRAVADDLAGSGVPNCVHVSDTSPEIDECYRAMLMQRTGEERLIMGCAMWDTDRAFVEASIREHDPQATVEAIRKGLFFLFYGLEFNHELPAKMLAALESAALPIAG